MSSQNQAAAGESDVEGEGGYKLATIDADTIRAWWKRWPRAMIGFSPGSVSVFVVDFDAGEDKKTGEIFEAAALQLALEGAIGGQLPATLFTRPPRGDVHLWFQKPDDVDEILNRSNLLGPQSRIDIRGDNGYVVLPPSLRDDGVAYAWGGDAEAAIAPAPAALVDMVLRRGAFEEKPAAGSGIGARAAAAVKAPAGKGDGAIAAGDDAVRKYSLSALDAELQSVRNAGKGGRNDALNIASLKLAQFVAAGGLNESFVRASLENAAADCGLIRDDGLRAVKATIESGFRKGRTQPRDLDEIRRSAADRQSRPRGRGHGESVTRDVGRSEDADAADRMGSSRRSSSAGAAPPPDNSNPPDSSFAPAPRPGTNGKPSSQTGAVASSAGGWGAGGEP